MVIQRNNAQRRRVMAEEFIDVAPEATDLLFEAEDVAELVAEVTGEEVQVEAEEDVVTFTVGEDEFQVIAEGDEEILEAVRKPMAGKKAVKSSAKKARRRPVRSSKTVARRTIKK